MVIREQEGSVNAFQCRHNVLTIAQVKGVYTCFQHTERRGWMVSPKPGRTLLLCIFRSVASFVFVRQSGAGPADDIENGINDFWYRRVQEYAAERNGLRSAYFSALRSLFICGFTADHANKFLNLLLLACRQFINLT